MASRYEALLERLWHAAVDEYGSARADDPVFRNALEVAVKQLALVADAPLDLTGPEPDHA